MRTFALTHEMMVQVVMSPSVYKMVAVMMSNQVKAFEDQFGEVPETEDEDGVAGYQ